MSWPAGYKGPPSRLLQILAQLEVSAFPPAGIMDTSYPREDYLPMSSHKQDSSPTIITVRPPVVPRDYMIWSVFNTIYMNLCCLGFVALAYSVKVGEVGAWSVSSAQSLHFGPQSRAMYVPERFSRGFWEESNSQPELCAVPYQQQCKVCCDTLDVISIYLLMFLTTEEQPHWSERGRGAGCNFIHTFLGKSLLNTPGLPSG